MSYHETRNAILEKAIQKAVTNGWLDDEMRQGPIAIEYQPNPALPNDGDYLFIEQGSRVRSFSHVNALIFDKDFAKALWGDKFINPEMRDDAGSRVIAIKRTAWRFHLQQMVIADDPIAYLGENT